MKDYMHTIPIYDFFTLLLPPSFDRIYSILNARTCQWVVGRMVSWNTINKGVVIMIIKNGKQSFSAKALHNQFIEISFPLLHYCTNTTNNIFYVIVLLSINRCTGSDSSIGQLIGSRQHTGRNRCLFRLYHYCTSRCI
jgi:hypothetical protein